MIKQLLGFFNKSKEEIVPETIECFCCSKQLNNWVYDSIKPDGEKVHIDVHPMGGLHFMTYGHYGSSVFDPVGRNEKLDIAICDECVTNRIRILRGSGSHALKRANKNDDELLAEMFDQMMRQVDETKTL